MASLILVVGVSFCPLLHDNCMRSEEVKNWIWRALWVIIAYWQAMLATLLFICWLHYLHQYWS